MRRILPALLLAAPTALAQPAPSDGGLSDPGWVRRQTAEIQALDKVNARVSSIRATVGQPANFGTLTITVRACHARPPDESPDSAAWVEITDSRGAPVPGGGGIPPGGVVFRGWLFAERPAANMLQHPVYDIRILACR
ncbi:MAG: DUF2155 domain-containing protein [Acetobacteraceae bacterium]|nr:DUF2155 domain-containing protein [Acetobacteraceae bacterium]